MRDEFRSWLRPTEDEFKKLWTDCLFVFDTNVLLNLYRYSEEARSDLLAVVEKISDRIWLPHQVGYEFYRGRLSVVAGLRKSYTSLLNQLGKHQRTVIEELDRLHRYSRIDKPALADRINLAFEQFKTAVQVHLDEHDREWTVERLAEGDPLEQQISSFFQGRVGAPYDNEDLESIYKDGRTRYVKKVPPGFEDDNKPEPDKFADLVIWKQIIDHAKAERRPVVLVTDDRKADWVRGIDGKVLGPRPELVDEFRRSTGQDFWLYSPEPFLTHATRSLKNHLQPGTVEEVREVSKSTPWTIVTGDVTDRDLVLAELHDQQTQLTRLLHDQQTHLDRVRRAEILRDRVDVSPADVLRELAGARDPSMQLDRIRHAELLNKAARLIKMLRQEDEADLARLLARLGDDYNEPNDQPEA